MQFIRLAIALRYPILGGAFLSAILPALSPVAPTITAIFMLDSYVRLMLLTFGVFSCASITAVCFVTIFYNIGERREDPKLVEFTERHKWLVSPVMQRIAFAAMVIPLPAVAGSYTVAEQRNGELGGLTAIAFIGIGGGLAMILIWGAAFLERYLFSYSQPVILTIFQDNRIAKRKNERQGPLDRLFRFFGPGFVSSPADGNVSKARPGHVLLLFYTFALLATYLIGYATLSVTDERSWLSTLFFVVVLLAIGQTIMSFLSFFADRFSVPPLFLVGVWVLITSATNSYHEFLVEPETLEGSAFGNAKERLANPPQDFRPAASSTVAKSLLEVESPVLGKLGDPKSDPATFVTVDELLEGWQSRQPDSSSPAKRDLVIVTAAGGGIQAAAWTSRVLTGLHRETGGKFSDSVCLISAVSGGSLGTMMYLANFPELAEAQGDSVATEQVLQHINAMASEESLTAAGWGMAFPDLIRGALPFGSYVVGTHRDRGHAVEVVWRSRMFSTWGRYVRSDWRLRDLAAGIRAGELPGVVFNSFGIDTGQRILISPCVLPEKKELPKKEEDEGEDNQAEEGEARVNLGVRYLEYARGVGLDLPISTAARLSASFPYVTPTSTPKHGPWIQKVKDKQLASLLKNLHFGDGGYTDNEGIMTALDFAKEIVRLNSEKAIDQRGFRDIVLVRIAPFPLPTELPTKKERSWVATQKYAGPPLGMYNARIASQGERGDWEFDLLKDAYNTALEKYDEQKRSDSKLARQIKVTKELTSDKSKLIENLRGVLDQTSLSKVKDEIAREMPRVLLSEVSATRSGIGSSIEKIEAEHRSRSLVKPIQVHEILIDFHVKKEVVDADGKKIERTKQPPLSWRLNQQQMEDLDTGWKNWLRKVKSDKEHLANKLLRLTTE